LTLATLLEELRAGLEPTLTVLAGDGDPATRTMLAIQTLMTTFRAHQSAAPAYVQAIAQAPMLPSLRAGLIELWAELRELLAGDITTMQERGELPSWIEPVTMAAVLVAVANGLVLHVTVDPEGPTLDEMATQIGSLLLTVRSPS